MIFRIVAAILLYVVVQILVYFRGCNMGPENRSGLNDPRYSEHEKK